MKKTPKVVASILVLAFFVFIAVGSEDLDRQTRDQAVALYNKVVGEDGPVKTLGKVGLGAVKYVVKPVMYISDAIIIIGAIKGSIVVPPAAPALIWGAVKKIFWTSVVVYGIEHELKQIVDDPPSMDFMDTYELKEIESYEPLDDSTYMEARARHLNKMAEQEELLAAILITFERMQGAYQAKEPEYVFLQVEVLNRFIELLEANLTEQIALIQLQVLELPGYLASFPEFDYEETVERLIQISRDGFSEDERVILLEAGFTHEEIKELEDILLDAPDWDEWDNGSLDALLAGMEKQVESINEMLEELGEASELLGEIIELAESVMDDISELEHLHDGGAGGGIYIGKNSTAILRDNIISDNTAVFGGGIAVLGGSTCTMDSNAAGGNTAKYGGGILVVESRMSMEGNTISGNAAEFGAGLFAFMEALVTAGGNSFIDNSAGRKGGAMWVCNQSLLELDTPDSNSYLDNSPDNIYRYE